LLLLNFHLTFSSVYLHFLLNVLYTFIGLYWMCILS
jgi:hypothetical protein